MSFGIHLTGFVLAAGEGKRLRPVTLERPKALVPFCGVPMLELAAARFAELPVDELVVNAWYKAEVVREFCGGLEKRLGRTIRVSLEPQLLDTGGGLRHGLLVADQARNQDDVRQLDLFPVEHETPNTKHMALTEHVIVHNADIVLDCDLRRLVEYHLEKKAAATVLLVPNKGPRTVELGPDGRIRAFRRPRGEGGYTFSGVHIFRRDVLQFLPSADVCSIITAYEGAMAAGLPVFGLSTKDAYWSDLGNPTDYIMAHGEVADCGIKHFTRLREAQAEQARRRAELEMRRGVRCTGAIGLGAELAVPAGAQLHNAVLWDGTQLTNTSLYADAVFTGGKVAPPVPPQARPGPDPRIWFCLDVDPATVRVEPLRKQGSGRRYERLVAADGRTWIWCAYAQDRRENAAFAALADFLERLDINIPEVIVHLGDVGEIVSRDLGGDDLQEVTDEGLLEDHLQDVLRQAARLHVLGARAARLEELPLQNGFTKGLYDWERDYFREHILGKLLGAPELWTPAAIAHCELRNRLLVEPLVPIHRDLQSANVMLSGGKAYLIDFQGMRPGCAAYDIASLLYDPYRCHPAERRLRLWRYYQKQVEELGGTPLSVQVFHAAAVQRLMQALGAYGKLWLTDGLDWYRQFILPALGLLEAAADAAEAPEVGTMARKAKELAAEKARQWRP